MRYSLLDYAENFDTCASPLPAQSDRFSRRSHGSTHPGAWPSDLLPAEPIALDLADRGVTYQRGVGYAVNGSYREADQIALLAVDLLVDVAERLPLERSAAFNSTAADIEAEIARRVDDLIDSEDADGPLFGPLYDGAIAFGGEFLRQGLDDALASGWVEAADERARNERSALRLTAKELRTSVAARGRLLARIRPHLPSMRPVIDHDAALAFLATLDAERTLRRSAVPILYADAGSPGNLDASQIRHLATERWGEPRQSKGHPSYHPAQVLVQSQRRAPAPVVAPAAPRPDRNTDRASAYVSARYSLDGDLPDRGTLAEIFSIDLAEADEILAAYAA